MHLVRKKKFSIRSPQKLQARCKSQSSPWLKVFSEEIIRESPKEIIDFHLGFIFYLNYCQHKHISNNQHNSFNDIHKFKDDYEENIR